LLQNKRIEYTSLSERWLSDNILPDTARYFFRIENWGKFKRPQEDSNSFRNKEKR